MLLRRLKCLGVNMQPLPRPNQIDHDKAEDKSHGRGEFKIQDGLKTYSSYFPQVAHTTNSRNQGQENDGCHERLDQLDEGIGEGLEFQTPAPEKVTNARPEKDRQQYLKVKTLEWTQHFPSKPGIIDQTDFPKENRQCQMRSLLDAFHRLQGVTLKKSGVVQLPGGFPLDFPAY